MHTPFQGRTHGSALHIDHFLSIVARNAANYQQSRFFLGSYTFFEWCNADPNSCTRSSAKLDGIHLITAVSVIKRLIYEFTPWGQDLVSVVCIGEGHYYGGFFGKKICENFVWTVETVWNRQVFVLESFPYQEVQL